MFSKYFFMEVSFVLSFKRRGVRSIRVRIVFGRWVLGRCVKE